MSKKPNILLFDIETSPNLAYIWGKYEQDSLAVERPWYILSVAWKWLGKSKIYVQASDSADDKKLCKILHNLLTKADIVIAHNGDQFDIKKAKARFIFHNLPPLQPIATVDTLKVARRVFKFDSNKLNDLASYLGLGNKMKHAGFDTWLGCMKGDKKAWKQMLAYNKHDVVLLERVYKRMRNWMDKHPSLAALKHADHGCPHCGSVQLSKWGVRANNNTVQQRWLCRSCGAYHVKGKVNAAA